MAPHDRAARLAALNEIAASQIGLVTAAQLRNLCFNNASVAHRLQRSKTWQRLLPGVYLTNAGRVSNDQRRLAALLYGGDDSILTGLAALTIHGSRVARRHEQGIALILVPHHRKRSSSGFVIVERTARWPRAVTGEGLRLAPPARAAIDAARRMTVLADVRALLADVVQSGLAQVADLRNELEASQRRGTRLARLALNDLDAGTRSAPEAALRDAWRRARLPEPLWNADLRTTDGAFLARPDAYVADLGLAVEVESREFHYSEADWRRTMARQSRMASHGIVVLQFPPSRLARDAAGVMAEVKTATASLAGRPLPRVTVRVAS